MTSDISIVLPKVKKNVPLSSYTTFKIGGPAKYFFIAKSKKDLIKAIKVAQKFKMPFFILGGGSNLLVDDRGFDGLVINFQFSIFNFQKNKIIVGAGLSLKKLVDVSKKRGLTGLEWAAGIPGTLGGAIRGNAGAFGHSISEVIREVEVLNKKLQVTLNCEAITEPVGTSSLPVIAPQLRRSEASGSCYKLQDLKFGYRDSIFKHNKNLIILSCQIELKKGNKKEIQKNIKEYLKERESKHPSDFPSAGSVFKNPKSKIQNPKLFKRFPELKKFKKKGMIPAAYLIEECGLKGKRVGGVMVSEKHSNFIINCGKGRAEDVIILISLIKQKVRNKFGIQLEEEIEYLPFI